MMEEYVQSSAYRNWGMSGLIAFKAALVAGEPGTSKAHREE